MYRKFTLHTLVDTIESRQLIMIITLNDDLDYVCLYDGNAWDFQYGDIDNEYGDNDVLSIRYNSKLRRIEIII